MTVARNEPCPCGSGRKYKRCCWAKDRAASIGARSGDGGNAGGARPDGVPGAGDSYTRRDRERALERLTRFAARREFADDVALAQTIFWGLQPEWSTDEAFLAVLDSDNGRMAFAPWLFFDCEIENGETIADQFVRREGTALRAGERAYVDMARESAARMYEITAVRPDEGFDLCDIETGMTVAVRERAATRQLVRWDLVAARVVPGTDGVPVIENMQAWFNARDRPDIEHLLRTARREQAKGPLAGDDMAFYRRFAPLVAHMWLARVALPPPPRIVTADGDPLAMVKATFDVHDAGALRQALESRDDVSVEDDGSFTWLEPGGRMLGRFVLAGARLTFEAMSEARVGRARAMLGQVAPGAAAYRMSLVEDPLAAAAARSARGGHGPREDSRGAANAPPRPARRRATRGDLPPEVEAGAVQQMLDRHYREWPDVPLPALDGRTPRHAAKLKTQKGRVAALLKDFESRSARERQAGRPVYDTSWLWDELGLERDAGA